MTSVIIFAEAQIRSIGLGRALHWTCASQSMDRCISWPLRMPKGAISENYHILKARERLAIDEIVTH